jgi:hypothetical protein
MVSAFNILYSASAVRRMLGIAQSVSIRIQQFAFVIWVHVKGQRPTFISKMPFRVHFAEWRKAQGLGLVATQWVDQATRFTVRNESKGSAYVVDASPSSLNCTCEDYKNQIQFLGRGCCKHGYAVLNKLGFNSLAKYIEAYKPGGYLSDPRYAKAA